MAVFVHMGIVVAYGMPTFGLVMLIGNLAFISPETVRRWLDPVANRVSLVLAGSGAGRGRAVPSRRLASKPEQDVLGQIVQLSRPVTAAVHCPARPAYLYCFLTNLNVPAGVRMERVVSTARFVLRAIRTFIFPGGSHPCLNRLPSWAPPAPWAN